MLDGAAFKMSTYIPQTNTLRANPVESICKRVKWEGGGGRTQADDYVTFTYLSDLLPVHKMMEHVRFQVKSVVFCLHDIVIDITSECGCQ